jgi:hypothetical protein
VPFRSTIAGRPAPQVGRWHSFRERGQDLSSTNWGGTQEGGLYEEDIDWEKVWRKSSIGRNVLPNELATLRSVHVTFSSSHR